MKTILVVVLAVGTAALGQETNRIGRPPVNPKPGEDRPLPAPKNRPAPKRPPAGTEAKKDQRLTLPRDAVKIEAFTYRWTDSDGKTWIYRETPFGLVRYEEEAARQREAAAVTEQPPLEAFDEGERVRFERQTPFGKQRWYRDKSELSGEEAEAWKRRERTGKTTEEQRPGDHKPDTE